jgi:hypothetical protein
MVRDGLRVSPLEEGIREGDNPVCRVGPARTISCQRVGLLGIAAQSGR